MSVVLASAANKMAPKTTLPAKARRTAQNQPQPAELPPSSPQTSVPPLNAPPAASPALPPPPRRQNPGGKGIGFGRVSLPFPSWLFWLLCSGAFVLCRFALSFFLCFGVWLASACSLFLFFSAGGLRRRACLWVGSCSLAVPFGLTPCARGKALD